MIKDLLLYFALLLWFVVPLQAQPTIFAEDVTISPNETAEILIKVEGFTDVIAWQFTLEWDSLVLEFVEFDQFNLAGLGENNFGPPNKVDFVISTWFESTLIPITLDDGDVVFSMKFKAIGELDDTSMLCFTGRELENKIVGPNGESLGFGTRMTMVTVANPLSATQTVPQNFDLSIGPNPFHSSTQIKFNLEESHSDFQVAIYSLDGKEVYRQKHNFSAGEQVLEVDQSMLPSTGMYLLNMTSENLHTTQKLFFENY